MKAMLEPRMVATSTHRPVLFAGMLRVVDIVRATSFVLDMGADWITASSQGGFTI